MRGDGGSKKRKAAFQVIVLVSGIFFGSWAMAAIISILRVWTVYWKLKENGETGKNDHASGWLRVLDRRSLFICLSRFYAPQTGPPTSPICPGIWFLRNPKLILLALGLSWRFDRRQHHRSTRPRDSFKMGQRLRPRRRCGHSPLRHDHHPL
jgi:hypothetical protein